MTSRSPVSPRELLGHMAVPGKRGLYLVGALERRVTVYSQQVRALNLIYSLFEEKQLEAGDAVAVIGGGVAGLTAAAAAARKGCKVTVLEKNQDLLHLFAGCTKRWLHPHIYDWPQPGSLRDDADDLEILTWRAAMAGDVVRHLRGQWDDIRAAYDIEVLRGVTVNPPQVVDGKHPLVTWRPGANSRRFRVVILAVGFGIEKPFSGLPFRSYWHDDALDQSDHGTSKRYLVSGLGDGGLIELVRACIGDFRHDEIVSRFALDVEANPEARKLGERLLSIDAEAMRHEQEHGSESASEHLWDGYIREIDSLAGFVDEALAEKVRGRSVVLNGPGAFATTLQASVLNRLLVARLLHGRHADYWPGTIQAAKPDTRGGWQITLADRTHDRFDEVIVRHGTEPALTASFPDIDDACRKELKPRNVLDQTRVPAWPSGFFAAVAPPTATTVPDLRDTPGAAYSPSNPAFKTSQRRSPDLIDFTGERSRHAHFFGRQDILRELDEWLRDRNSGWLLLTGSPGLGKSAIFHHWLELREQAGLPVAFHFIRRGVQNWADPAVVRASLAAQIERDFPEQRDAGADPAQRLDQLLHWVSPVLVQRQQELVLLVDGLDEAMTLGIADNPIPRIFPHELPARVFVFAASRPLYPHLDWFTRRSGTPRTIDLDRRSGNLVTVHEFWTALRETLSPPPADDLVRAAVERSEGNLYHAVKLYQRWRQPGAERSIDAIPYGFEGMLREFWERLEKLRDEQWEIARQGLSLLCAARQALPLGVIDELLGWSEGNARRKLLPLVRELLHEEHWHEQPAFRPYHEGVRDLVARELPGTLREHHRRLARLAAWPAAASGFRRGYALRHRVVHQVRAGELEEAAASCRDVDYLTEKSCALGVVEVEREIQLVARAQEPAARKQLATLALAVGACSHWARETPKALPALLHDRLLSYAPAVHRELVWPAGFRLSGPLLRHPLQTGGLVRILEGHQLDPKAVAVLPDGRVVSGSADNTLRVWDVESGQALATLAGHEGSISAVAVLPDGRVISGSADNTLRVWDVERGQAIATLVGHRDLVRAVAVLPDGRVISGSADNTLRVWDVERGRAITTLVGHEGSISTVAVLPDGRVVSGSDDGTLCVWDVGGGQALATLAGHQGSILAAAVLLDGRVVSGAWQGSLQVWDVESRQVLATLAGHEDSISAVAVLPDGHVVSGSADKTLRVWDVESGQVLATLAGHEGSISAVAVLPVGRVVSGSADKTLRVWDVESGQTPATLAGHRDWVLAMAVLPDGRAVSGSADETLRVWDVESGQALATLVGHDDWVLAVAVLPDGRVVSGSADNTLRVWDMESGQALAMLAGHEGPVSAVAVLPDGRVVSGSADLTLRVWDVESGQELATLAGHLDHFLAVTVLPDGRVVSGSADNTLRVWDVARGQVITTLVGHRDWVGAVAVLPDGRVVSGSADKTLRVWDVERGQVLATLVGHQNAVLAVAVLPNGRVVSGSADKTLRVWDIERGQVIATVHGDASFQSVAVVCQHLIVAGDALGNVWFIDLP